MTGRDPSVQAVLRAAERSGQEALRAALGGDDLAWLRAGVRRRLERALPASGTVQLEGPTLAQRQAVARLLGRPTSSAATLRVRLADVSAALSRAGLASDVAQAVVSLEGPVTDRRAERRALHRSWSRVYEHVDTLAARHPQLASWTAGLVERGNLRRLAGDPVAGRQLIADLGTVLDHLPAPAVRLERFASDVLGDAHALDHGRPVATLALGAVRALVGEPTAPEAAEARRESWAAVGVLIDDLLSQVLVLALPGGGGGVADRMLAAAAGAGEPLWLPLGMLTRHPPRLEGVGGREVFVVENTSVVATAADRFGPACRPLVCTNGQPTVAVIRLLDVLRQRGVRLRYHGDFDWGGITIANRVFRRAGFVPWRFDAATYERYAATATTPLRGRAVAPAWDAALGFAMRAGGVRVEQEALLDALLADLRSASNRG